MTTKTDSCWVIKIGSALLTEDGVGLRSGMTERLVEQIMQLRQSGHRVVIVSSGAVAEGIARLGWQARPRSLHEQQAAAAVGQMGLIQAWESCFQRHDVHTAQILLTHDDISDRNRYLNARSTLRTLLDLGVVPVVNENDTVATEEIRFGDNDSLAGLASNLVEADLLVILTDQDGLFDSDPRHNRGARLIDSANAGDPALETYAGEGGQLGRGGMLTKLRAARIAAKSGTDTIIANGAVDDILVLLSSGSRVGTRLTAEKAPLAARKQWLAGLPRTHGEVVIDDGARKVLVQQGKSLLAVGVKAVQGEFFRGEIVSCVDEAGREIARGLINYNAAETRRIMGRPSSEIEGLLGYVDETELIHRDNLILM